MEHGVAQDRFPVMVRLDRSKLCLERRSDLIAAMLRTIAECAGGSSSISVAYDEDITTPMGMRFCFAEFSSRESFKTKIEWYMDPVAVRAVSIKIGNREWDDRGAAETVLRNNTPATVSID